jgi:hypothetical protein
VDATPFRTGLTCDHEEPGNGAILADQFDRITQRAEEREVVLAAEGKSFST